MGKDEMNVFDMQFPMVKNVPAKTIASELTSMNAGEVAIEMEKFFKRIEEKFGYKVAVIGDEMPTRALVPTDRIKRYEE